MPDQESVPTPVAVLLVCTGNICRSAVGERLGRAYLGEVLGPAGADVDLVSAGTRAVVGSRMHPDSALVLSGLGGDAEGFVARQLEPWMVEQADLVLTLTRDHRRDVLGLVPRALARTFTLREAADLLRALGDRRPGDDGDFAEPARALVAALAAARPGRSGGDGDDIADPIGRPLEHHQEVGQAVAEALLPVLAAVVALHPDAAVPDASDRAAAHVDRGASGTGARPDAPQAGPAHAAGRSAQPDARRHLGVLGRRRRVGSGS
ncbi:protein-tyrosine-phosphatase [Blastococcus xanthinilyticus]|uniref:Protein-tyrosine phosphatase n=1 Tax=Blastococcus xanthinilyticus TaxID=1564164 RepID=A0A5S5CTY6_9ACTN|nr:protein-tyrosine-phosphatase [Blastococcus xanthinilyticus]TYP87183.1 protein-tyrosine phosphatase [Blastococcus xanthinilyticus]